MTADQIKESLGVLVKGESIRIMDQEGNSYIDGQSGMWVLEVGHGRKFKFISRRGSYHGNTYGCMSICPSDGFRHSIFVPLAPIGLQVFPPYCYRV